MRTTPQPTHRAKAHARNRARLTLKRRGPGIEQSIGLRGIESQEVNRERTR